MRTEPDQQESKPTTRRARGEGRKPAARKPAQKAPARKSQAKATKAAAQAKSAPESKTRRSSTRKSASSSKLAASRTSDAEEAVDRMGEQIGRFASLIGREVLRATARAREEIEDMVAEAQSIRENLQGSPHSHQD